MNNNEDNVIHASPPKEPIQNPIGRLPQQRPRVQELKGYNETQEDLAKKISDQLNDQNKIPIDARPRARARNLDGEITVSQKQNTPRNVINAGAANTSINEGAPRISSGTTSKGLRHPNKIIASPEAAKAGGIINSNRVKNVSPTGQRAKTTDIDPESGVTSFGTKAEGIEAVPERDYMYINKPKGREPEGIFQQVCYNLLNSNDPVEMFEKLKDDKKALAEIRLYQAVFADCKNMQYLIDKYNEYMKHPRAWQRIRR